MNKIWQVLGERRSQLLTALAEHIEISLISLLLALLIALPLGIYLTRKRKLAEIIIGITAVLQTIPSLALLGLLIPLVGIGKVPAIIALVIYALLPILRVTYTGIKEVDPALLEAANAMGMNTRKRLLKVELPLAMPVIMAGIRTAAVLIIATATIAALIGAGGLGDLILLGIDRNDTALLVIGAVPAALLAIVFDLLLRRLEQVSFRRTLVAATVFAALAAVVIIIPLLHKPQEEQIVAAGKLGTEPEILIHMYKLLIEDQTDLTVKLEPNLGNTMFVFNALKSGSIDLYPEFTGTAIAQFVKEPPVSNDSAQVYEQARIGMSAKWGMTLLEPMKYNNTYALAVPKAFAEEHHLKTISDLARIQEQVKAGFTREFTDRDDGYPGLQKAYGLDLPSVIKMESKLRYGAIEHGDVNLVDAFSTDSELQKYQLTVLEDDRHFFPPYQGAPLLRQETLDRYPELVPALNQLSGKITDDQMRKMNYEVSIGNQTPETAAKAFLTAEGLLN